MQRDVGGISVGESPVRYLAIRDLGPSQFSRLSALLDEAMDMPDAQQKEWLAALDCDDPVVVTILTEMLASRGGREEAGFLALPLSTGELNESIKQDPLIGQHFGPYRVLSELGHGGMGSVWLAERADGLFTRHVALKLIQPALWGRVTSERFTREREILAGLNHPNIARLLDAGDSAGGQPYLALEYVAGAPLTTYCDEHGLSIRERLELFLQVLGAVQHAHGHLVVHRDLKPSNILVSDDGQVHLLDFGIAKLLTEGQAKETELTLLGGRALTLDYAAPEQISGAPVTISADVYALGVMLYELMTGERPYRLKRDSRGALEEAILQMDPILPSRVALSDSTARARATTAAKLAKTLKGDLDTIVAKSLKKSPQERYATINAFSEDIGRFLRGDIVLAQPDSVNYRALKFARRHRVAIAAAGVLVLTLIGGLAATTYEARVAATQRDEARAAQLRLLTQVAAARVKENDVAGGMGIILEVLPRRRGRATGSYAPEALSVFQDARAADVELTVLSGHADRVRSVRFSPDGRRVVTASYDHTARIWDAGTGREILQLIGHTDGVLCAAYSADGRYIITASVDKSARIWDAATGREILRLTGHTDRVQSAAFSPDGRRVATASHDRTARTWDAATGKQVVLFDGHTDVVTSAEFSPDGGLLVTASHDKTARVWDASTGRELIQFNGHAANVNGAAFSPDGSRVVSVGDDENARIWRTTTGEQTLVLSGHTLLLSRGAFSPDGRQIITGSSDKTVRTWDADSGKQLMLLAGHTLPVIDTVFSPDGRRIATASADRTARIWDSGTDVRSLSLIGHERTLTNAEFSPDGTRIATASLDNTARVWEAATGKELAVLTGHEAWLVAASFSPDGRRVVTASHDHTARIFDATAGKELIRLSGHALPVESAAFSPHGERVVTASQDRTARIWDATTGRALLQLEGHLATVNSAVFSPDGRLVVTGSMDKTARIWNAGTGRQIMVLNGHSAALETSAFSPDGARVVTASEDGTALIWDVSTGREIQRLTGHTGGLTSALFSADGRRVATSSYDGTARIWDAARGQQIMALRHRGPVFTAAFSPDGLRVVTSSEDKVGRVWDARAAAIDFQISWAGAAEFEALSAAERLQLGLPGAAGIRQWPVRRSKCDEAAAAPYDPDRLASGATLDRIVTDVAVVVCAEPRDLSGRPARAMYELGRAQFANHDFALARRNFERALADGYPAARIDLGMLLSDPSAGMLDVSRTMTLYEQAWIDGQAIAAFKLGQLYEHGVARLDTNSYVFEPDESQARRWYQRAADSGNAYAQARLAESAEAAAATDEDAALRNSHLLDAFKHYAVATERARREDWPDDAWKDWRYRRASLARLLARAGMMGDVATIYEDVLQNP